MTRYLAAAPAFTTIPVCEPVRDPSPALIDCVPAVLSVTAKVPVPEVSVEGAATIAAPSELVIVTVPAYPVTVLLPASSAVTVTLWLAPATVGLAKPVTARCVAAPTVMLNAVLVAAVSEPSMACRV